MNSIIDQAKDNEDFNITPSLIPLLGEYVKDYNWILLILNYQIVKSKEEEYCGRCIE